MFMDFGAYLGTTQPCDKGSVIRLESTESFRTNRPRLVLNHGWRLGLGIGN